MNIKGLAIAAVLISSLGLAGCSVEGTNAGTVTHHSSSAAVSTPTAKPASNVLSFGETFKYTDGVEVTVGAPGPFTPSAYAAGVTAGQTAVAFTLTIKNGSPTQFTPFAYPSLNSGGTAGTSISDIGNPIGNVGDPSSTVLLPGQSVSWLVGFSVANVADLTMDVQPSMAYQNAIFTNTAH